MIQICGKVARYEKVIRIFVRWLNRKYPLKAPIRLRTFGDPFLSQETLDAWKANYSEGDEFYGMYDDETGTILLALGVLDETMCLLNLAHEHRHAYQHIEGKRLREQDADAWASQVMLEWQSGD